MAKKSNKRITKKHKKQALQKRFKDTQSSYKTLTKKEKSAEYRQRTYDNKKSYADKKGYRGIIPKSWTYTQINDAITAQKKADKARKTAERKERKYEMLVNSGIDEKYARYLANRDTGFKKINALIGEHKASAWLGVMWSDVTGETDFSEVVREAVSLSTQEKIEYIKEMYQEALDDPDGSDQFHGVAIIIIAKTREACEKGIQLAMLRGYGVKICCDNKFTIDGYARIMYSAMAFTSNQSRIRAYEDFEKYAYNFIGADSDLYNMIFN